ncbi:MAG: GNAT family N-acetyltransferase [Acetatifactor sp.]|nr:GNAT family N-acetyltransferase [Acetatifactor sp.]
MNLNIRKITPADDAKIASIVRSNLEKYGLNKPGTAYFDPMLDHLSGYYDELPDTKEYFVLTEDGEVIGGVGYERLLSIDACAELQKIYLTDEAKGRGYGKKLLGFLEKRAADKGYKRVYLETHSCLKEAISLYKKTGYCQIDKPDFVIHSAMDMFFLKELKD